MKEIGIMSMQRIVNYGSFLQAYGLKSIVESLGEYNVQFVDYKFGMTACIDVKPKSLFKKIVDNRNIVKFINKKRIEREFDLKYKNYINILNIDDEKNYYPNIDTLIIGSDEVFNCTQPYPVGFSKELFGENYEKINVISYAASFGYTTMDSLEKYNICEEVKSLLNNNFSALSVRDENSLNICRNLTNKEIYTHLDPVLLADFSAKIPDQLNESNYIIVYAYQGRISKAEGKYIKNFAKKHNKKIISLGFYQEVADYNIVVSPFEVLEYFKKADFIITDTFHGTIFSVITKNKFATIIRDSNKNKISSLLAHIKLDSRMVKNLSDIETLFNTQINYEDTESVISYERNRTNDYLMNNL